MKTKRLKRCALAFAMLFSATCAPEPFLSTASADGIDLHRLMSGPDRCDHVISLLMRYGVNNDVDQYSNMQVYHPLGPIQLPTSELGDLQLVSIAKLADVHPGCGPTFEVTIKNCSTRAVHGMRLTLVGLLGRICPTSPSVTEKIDCLAAGAIVQLNVSLPVEAMAMGQYNGAPIPMNRLLVAVDSYDQFMESNEANNLKVMEMGAIPIASVVEASDIPNGNVAPASVGSPQRPSQESSQMVSNIGPDAPAASIQNPSAAPQQNPGGAGIGAAGSGSAVAPSDLRSAIEQFGQQNAQNEKSAEQATLDQAGIQ
ncbi:hypothetical protein LOC67_19900 [Stieleria sp. JC731]|uniref:hypothetical protein n=1 Tax=Pirellulaceae TaxID=2691357 RepID=UPI001E37F127|nr:hypothetical protein [Stieleria sp. JC731]MCC9602821.1 hypothetical protein [Stieleria sp. JC731]